MTEEEKNKIIDIVAKRQPGSMQDLVKTIIDETGYDKNKVRNIIINMIENNEIILKKMDKKTNYKEYLLSYKLFWFWILMCGVFSYIIILFASGTIIELNALKIILGGLMTLLFPGYALVRTLFIEDTISAVERMALSIGLSIAITPMISFILNFSPLGISIYPITICLSFLTIILSILGSYRQYKKYISEI